MCDDVGCRVWADLKGEQRASEEGDHIKQHKEVARRQVVLDDPRRHCKEGVGAEHHEELEASARVVVVHPQLTGVRERLGDRLAQAERRQPGTLIGSDEGARCSHRDATTEGQRNERLSPMLLPLGVVWRVGVGATCSTNVGLALKGEE